MSFTEISNAKPFFPRHKTDKKQTPAFFGRGPGEKVHIMTGTYL